MAALFVFAFHVRTLGFFSGEAQIVIDHLFGAGATGVSLFFILSGFVLAHTHTHTPGRSPGAFWRHRLARIYPLHLTTFIAALALGATVLPQISTQNPAAAFSDLLLASAWNIDWWQAGNPVSWSLACEAFFYLCFPLLFRLVARMGRPELALASIGSAALVFLLPLAVLGLQLPLSPYSFPVVRLPEFVLGVLLARLVSCGHWRGPTLRLALTASLLGYAASTVWPGSPLAPAGYTVVGFSLLVAALARADQDGRKGILASPVLVRLGTLSFAFYLVHLLTLQIAESAFPRDVLSQSPLLAVIVVAAALAVSLGAAWLLHRFIELPGRRVILGDPAYSAGQLRALALTLSVVTASTLLGGIKTPNIPPATVVIIGASISGGFRVSAGEAWPNIAAESLDADHSPLRIVNASIGATRLLESFAQLPSSLSRETADGLSVTGVRRLVLTDLINDIQAEPHQYDPQTIIGGILRFVDVAHRSGVAVTVTTITPYGGFERFDPAGEACRIAVNDAIRSERLADDYLDEDRVVANPLMPDRVDPSFDSGDHLHPNSAGQRAIGELAAAELSEEGSDARPIAPGAASETSSR